MPSSIDRISASTACVSALLALFAAPGTAGATHSTVEMTRIAGHPMRVSTHVDVLDRTEARIAHLELGEGGGRPGTRLSPAVRPSRLAALPGRWCGTERSTDDTSHASSGAPRVKVVYAYPSGAPNRFHLYKDLIQQDVELARAAVATAARGRRTIRFDMGTDCPGGGARYVDIQTIALPHDASHYGLDADSASARIGSDLRRSLRLRGRWNVTAYVDGVRVGAADGIASQPLDETHGRSNDANRGGQRAFLFGDGSAEFSPFRSRAFVHETLHMLGAVQDGAPHATGLGHCFDGADVMCYDDGGPKVPSPPPEPSCAGALRIDCRGDDYFAARPARGSYLARRWNLFDSAFMCAVASCDTPDAHASVRTALSTAVRGLTSRLRRAGLPGLLRRRTLRVDLQGARPGRLGLTIAAGGRELLVGHRAVGPAGRTTVIARPRTMSRRLSRATRLRVAVRLSFRSGRRRHVTRASTLLVRRP